MSKIIKFYPVPMSDTPPPVPSKNLIPDWYKDITLYNISNSQQDLQLDNYNNGIEGTNISLKLCTPTYDAFAAGYCFVLPEDIKVKINEDGRPSISWESELFVINRVPEIEMPLPPYYHPISFTFRMMYGVHTPPGTSVLVSHPFNRWDLPFIVPSAIVDSDKKFAPIDIRFFLRRGFEGIIEKGTPIFQVVPFTREPWSMEVDKNITEEMMWEHENRRTYCHSWYTKELVHKKEWN